MYYPKTTCRPLFYEVGTDGDICNGDALFEAQQFLQAIKRVQRGLWGTPAIKVVVDLGCVYCRLVTAIYRECHNCTGARVEGCYVQMQRGNNRRGNVLRALCITDILTARGYKNIKLFAAFPVGIWYICK